ncbi:hypothetical protein OIE62_07635 [Streptomyces scopuliridis]|uniref:Uncharacterized protein n=1 Tax=Streptomyces scopuliridis TaxID=452529 RepID=A0ACD4ZTE3_9ACTN|nr:hypothetical protein [Streptomyces scopuliridis]WSC01563.1 hypothetical protein OG835_34185 [Streptomyces scopuliridis]WSC04899.1 hypothetical protein OIE62_07635 [Streptomyces scopuliridis]
MSSDPIRILRGQGGQVEAEGPCDAFAATVLKRAGFMTFPTLYGQWVRLPFDMGEAWETEHASWAADMLTAARYPAELDPSLRTAPPDDTTPPAPMPRRSTAAMTTQPAPPARSARR